MTHLPWPLMTYELLKRIGSGYTAQTLAEEDGALVEGWITCMMLEGSNGTK